MKKISLFIMGLIGLTSLQACTSKTKFAECPASTLAAWNGSSAQISPLINGYGAVHETYIKLERRGVRITETDICEMSRIYCPAPHTDKGCQTYKCDYTEPANAVFKSKDYQGTKYYNAPSTGRVIWDGSMLLCENP